MCPAPRTSFRGTTAELEAGFRPMMTTRLPLYCGPRREGRLSAGYQGEREFKPRTRKTEVVLRVLFLPESAADLSAHDKAGHSAVRFMSIPPFERPIEIPDFDFFVRSRFVRSRLNQAVVVWPKQCAGGRPCLGRNRVVLMRGGQATHWGLRCA